MSIKENLLALVTLVSSAIPTVTASAPLITPHYEVYQAQSQVVFERKLDLTDRLPDNEYGNQIFADNILLALHYLKNDVQNPQIDWEKTREPFKVSFTLNPGQMFAFHKNVAPEYIDSVVKTMNSRFYTDEGYKSFGGLGGNGVCHLASLINWVASEAGLEVISPVDHNFFPIPGVPKTYGTSIRYAPEGGNSQNQNLYVKNNLDVLVTFVFEAHSNSVDLKVLK